MVTRADQFFAGRALEAHALQCRRHGGPVQAAGLDDGLEHHLGADVVGGQRVVGVDAIGLAGGGDQLFVQRGVDLVPVLRTQVHALEHVAAQLLELVEAGRPHHQHFHAVLDAEVDRLAQGVGGLATEVEQHQHVGLGGDGVGQVAGKFLLLQRVVAVADVFHAELGEHFAGVVQQGIAEYVLRGDGVPALGLGQLAAHRDQGFADGTIGGHRPAEG